VVKKDGEDQLGGSSKKLGSVNKRKGGQEYTTNNKEKAG